MAQSRAAALAAGSALVSALLLIASSIASGSGKERERGLRASSASTPITQRDQSRDCRFNAEVVVIPLPPALLAKIDVGNGNGEGGVAGGGACPQEISALTSSDFGPGSYVLQGGMAQGEAAGASYVLDPSKFPLRIDL